MARKSPWQITKEILGWCFLALVLAIVAVQLLGSGRVSPNWKSFVIQSGSMEPSIRVGDVVFVQKNAPYQENEVITFATNDGRVVTHRILEAGQEGYQTRGDANQTPDVDLVQESNVIGSVVLVLPKLGYLLSFAKTPLGVLLLVVIPATVLVVDELGFLKRTVEKR